MAELVTAPNLADPDAAYTLIIEAHRDLAESESQRLNAKLVLTLANHVGDVEVLRQAIALARETMERPVDPAD